MAEAVNTSRIGSAFDRARLERIADWLAVAVVVSLPWSTSATGILIVVWLAALVPTLDMPSLRRELTSAPGGLPVLLWLLAVAGMLWAPVGFSERIEGLGGFHKLLVIPLLLLQFRRSGRGIAALYAFLASCTLLLIASWVLKILWDIEPREGLYVPGKIPGIPVKDYIAQSTEFLVCAFGLLAVSFDVLRARRVAFAIALAVFALLFIANIYYVSPGRTALVVIPLLIAILGLRQYGWKGLIGASLAGAVVLGVAWSASPFLRGRVLHSFHELDKYRQENAASSTALRIEFWKKSASFIAEAPLIGHGIGSMPELFRRAAASASGAGAVTSVNPHNQFFAVAVQLGLLGGAVLVAMWIAHLALFRGGGLVAWIGLAIVVQNVVSSLFNSHLFDFFHGWFYVFGVGILGGMALRGANGSAPTDGASS